MKGIKNMFFIVCLLVLASIGFGFNIEHRSTDQIVFPKLNVNYNGNILYVDKPDGYINIIKNKNRNVIKEKIDETGMLIFNDKIYYISKTTKELCSIDFQGKIKNVFGKSNVTMPYRPMFILENFLYYYNLDNILVRIDSEENAETVMEDATNQMVYHITANSLIDGEYLYFWDDTGVYKMKIVDQKIEKIGQQYIYDKISFYGDEIYYIDNTDYNLHSMNKNGEDDVILSKDKIINIGADFDSGNLQIEKNDVYYTANNKLYKMNISTTQKKMILNNVSYFVAKGDKIYSISKFDNGELCEFNMSSGKIEKIAKGDFIPYIEVMDEMLFYGIKSKFDYLSGQGEIISIEI